MALMYVSRPRKSMPLGAQAAKIAAGQTSLVEKVAALHAFVRDEIRTQLAIGVDIGEDERVDQILADRQGSPIAKALVLQSMLAGIKVDSQMVWVVDRNVVGGRDRRSGRRSRASGLSLEQPAGGPRTPFARRSRVRRAYPAREALTHWRLDLPEGWCPPRADTQRVDNALGSFSQIVGLTPGGRVAVERRTRLGQRWIEAEQLPDLKELALAEHRATRRRIRLRCDD